MGLLRRASSRAESVFYGPWGDLAGRFSLLESQFQSRIGASGSSCRDGDPLDADKFQFLLRKSFYFEAKYNGFPDALGEFVQRPSLRVTTRELGDRGNVITLFVALDDDIELMLHRRTPPLRSNDCDLFGPLLQQ